MSKKTEALIARLREEATYDLNHETIALLIEAAEALAQPEQEPVASNVQAQWLGNALFDCIKASGIIRKDIGSLSVAELLFFSQDLKGMLERQAATRAQPEQEPVATVTSETGNPDVTMSWWHEPALPVGTKLYTTPPKREWVGLPDDEIEQGCKESWVTEQAFQSAVWWAETKLKEKNT